MAAPNLCPQWPNCFIHSFSDAGRFDLNLMLCPVWSDGNIPFLVALQEGRPTTLSLSLFFANFLAMERTKEERITGRAVTDAIIDLPTCYNVNRSVIVSAAASIGIRIREFLERPIFAALAYAPFQQNVRKVLVFEFGGGTLCSSLLDVQRSDGIITILASEPINGCPLFKFLRRELGIQSQEHGSIFRRLYAESERVKNALCSGQPIGKVDVRFLQRRPGVKMLPPVVNLDMLTNLNLHSIRRSIDQCLLQAGESSFDAVDEVILVGVSVGIPIVRRTLESLFPGRRLRDELDPGTFVRARALLLAASLYNNAMVVSMDHIDRMWPEL
ncbi:hypothetical protein HPP92_015101 [Vanilla planifolia]|uniref:Uncharacterized protein n=1 Tax=Vanilla planifolia TaxID=51239 RepID=A0A835QL96_VANPL|nr:hypothetical protein HPP92_015613 [Vanilla planifolia]KAG0475415.1 hypothetical protein HPP92_015101 [Vanilla planifolia]